MNFKYLNHLNFFKEQQVAIANRNEEGYDIYSSTQWTNFVHRSVGQVLGITNLSSINVLVNQLGGGYGGKVIHPI